MCISGWMSTDRFETPCTQCERMNRDERCTGPELSAPFIWGKGNRLSIEQWCEMSVRMSNQIHQTPEDRVFIQLGGKSLYVQTLKEIYKNEPKKFDQLISRTRS